MKALILFLGRQTTEKAMPLNRVEQVHNVEEKISVCRRAEINTCKPVKRSTLTFWTNRYINM